MFYVEMEARRSAKVGRPIVWHCRECQREKNNARRADRQAYSDRVKVDRGCADCGIKRPEPEVYDFDHLPGAEKIANVSTLLTKGSWDQFTAEIEKCEVVCANCHRVRTRNRDADTYGRTRGPYASRTQAAL